MALSQELQLFTGALHRRAECSGIVAAVLRGAATREGYALLLRNLLPAYRGLEAALEIQRELAVLAPRELLRSAALENDLQALCGVGFEQEVALLDAGARYAERISLLGREQPLLLAAHAYTRYLGDLSGGVILGRLLARSLSLTEDCLAFYRFPDIADLGGFKRGYRNTLDAIELAADERRAILEEARTAFRHNIEVSEAVQTAVAVPRD